MVKNIHNSTTSLFEWKSKKGVNHFAILFNGYKDVKFLYLASSTNILSAFKGCDELKTKIRNKEEGYTILEATTEAERVSIWKKLIVEAADCVKTQ